MDRERRSNAKKDYKKMHEGEDYDEIYKMPDPVITPGRSCTKSPALTAEPFTPTGSSMTPGRKELLGPAKSKVKVETETSTSGINTTTNNNIDLEMELMEADEEIARLTAELQTAGKQRELESKRREIAKLRGELQHQSGSQSTGASSTTTSSSRLPSSIASGKRSHEGEVDITGNIDMDNLRKMDRLVQKVDKHMNDLKVRFCQDSDDDSGSGESDSISNEQKEIKMSKSKNISGLRVQPGDRVKYPQRYPHAALQYEYLLYTLG